MTTMDKMIRDNIDSLLNDISQVAYCLSGLVSEYPKNAYNYYLMISCKIDELRETLGVDDNGKA
jgi:carbon monoxide dehydrogenase subunit G